METLKDFMDKKAVAEVLDQIAAFLELKGENPFRIRAFRTAARAIGSGPERPCRQATTITGASSKWSAWYWTAASIRAACRSPRARCLAIRR